MDFGLDVIGNATIICYENEQTILATDPWFEGSAYFGSWGLSHEVPRQQQDAIKSAKYLWCSHGHPDHINPDSFKSLTQLEQKPEILLADHVGNRISEGLRKKGFSVTVLPDRKWHSLSDKISILNIADYNQDAILLINMNGRLFVNLNDAFDFGWGRFVRKEIKRFKDTYLLAICGHGEATHVNYYDEHGHHDHQLNFDPPLGSQLARLSNSFGTNHIIPFSTQHKYRREDSVWANKYIASNHSLSDGFNNPSCTLLSEHIRIDCLSGEVTQIKPKENPDATLPIETFGDNHTDEFSDEDIKLISHYFKSIESLQDKIDFITVKAGGKEHTIPLVKRRFERGITFECPRNSFMQTIEWEIFDDLLIGNFMKTTLHGKWPKGRLYPDFGPFVGKYADNGFAKSKEELREYFEEYKKRQRFDYAMSIIEKRTIDIFRGLVPQDSKLFSLAKDGYYFTKKHI